MPQVSHLRILIFGMHEYKYNLAMCLEPIYPWFQGRSN
jgi:hypothetical protein